MLAIASDHGGYPLKEIIKDHLKARGVEFFDFGTDGEQSCDYPLFAERAARAVAEGNFTRAILLCGTGIGVSITANKVTGIRAALCNDLFCARLSREHNDANVLCMGGRVVGPGLAQSIVDVWLDTPFSGEERHMRRIREIGEIRE